MFKQSLIFAAAGFALTAIPMQANAQSGSYWSYDGRSAFQSYQACEQSRKTRTIGGAAVGGAVGAGLGAFAGGNDTRNSVIGGVIGAVAGAEIGRNQVKCERFGHQARQTYGGQTGYTYAPRNTGQYQQPTYSNHGQYRHVEQRGYVQTTPRGYTSNHSSNRGYTTQRYPTNGHSVYGTSAARTHSTYRQPTTNYGYSNQGYSSRGYSHQNSGYRTTQPTYSSHQSRGYEPHHRGVSTAYGNGRTQSTYWSHDGRTQFRSLQECQNASKKRTIASGGLGALAGAGLGTLAGGDDGRNAVFGAVAGGIAGAVAGRNSLRCQQYASNRYR